MTATAPLDLFTPIVADRECHPNFRAMLHDSYAPARDVVQGWAAEFIDRDGKFVREFQTTFNSSFWELYLFALFRDFRFEIDLSHPAPDFLVKTPYEQLAVEAVTTNHPKGGIPESDHQSLATTLKARTDEEAVDLASVRLTNTLAVKHQKYRKSYEAMQHVARRPFVVAVAPFEQPGAFSNNIEAVCRVLYGVRRKLDHNGQVVEIHENEIVKAAGVTIPIGLFTNDRMKEISAIIYSNTATMGKVRALSADDGLVMFRAVRYQKGALHPRIEVSEKKDYRESLADGLYVLHNPYAVRPVDFRTFFARAVNQYEFDARTKTPIANVSDGHLIQRFCIKLTPKK